jgi:hypothetical protein
MILLKLLKPILLIFMLVNLACANAQVQISTYEPATIKEIDQQQFLRIKSNEKNIPESLQLANVRYVPESGIPEGLYVDLISVVHIADKQYYKELNKEFEKYDAVLYELVAEEGTRISENDKGKGKGMLHALQNGLKSALGLSFQLDEVDYTPKNFIHADISADDFAKSMEQRGESFFSMFLRMWLVGLQQQASNPNAITNMDLIMALMAPDSKKQLKILAAHQFSEMEPVMKALDGENGSTIITERNLKALKVLRQQIEKGNKKFAIFYGAAHMPEMAEVLMQEFKMKKESVRWLDAWDLMH